MLAFSNHCSGFARRIGNASIAAIQSSSSIKAKENRGRKESSFRSRSSRSRSSNSVNSGRNGDFRNAFTDQNGSSDGWNIARWVG